jgi:hypothetical protein
MAEQVHPGYSNGGGSNSTGATKACVRADNECKCEGRQMRARASMAEQVRPGYGNGGGSNSSSTGAAVAVAAKVTVATPAASDATARRGSATATKPPAFAY